MKFVVSNKWVQRGLYVQIGSDKSTICNACLFALNLGDRARLRLYTQNIDSLERKVGVDEADLIECHGTTLRAKCDECRKVCSREDPSEKSRRASETHAKVATCYIMLPK